VRQVFDLYPRRQDRIAIEQSAREPPCLLRNTPESWGERCDGVLNDFVSVDDVWFPYVTSM
jgi:hypothetical protein